MIDLERRSSDAGVPPDILMEHAGLAIARHVNGLLKGAAGREVLIIVGPGNNGGDGLVAARHLHDWGARVHLYLPMDRKADDKNYRIVKNQGIQITLAGDDRGFEDLSMILSLTDVVIDAVFGTGKLRPIEGTIMEILNRVGGARDERPAMKIVAVDLPSGVDSDTGAADPSAVAADMTLTLGYPKTGLFYFPGSDLLGELVIADIGIPAGLGDEIRTELITDEWVRSVLPKRPRNAHKGIFGKVMVCAGSLQYIGAAYLACEAAMRAGAGLVTLATARSLHPVLAAKLTEVTYAPLPETEAGFISPDAVPLLHEQLADYDVLLIGCGLSRQHGTVDFTTRVLLDMPPSISPKIIIDADALNALAQTPDWWQSIRQDAILTPHPGEMGRLSGLSMDEISGDRLKVAREHAAKWDKTIILKGAHTIIASPDGGAMVNGAAIPGLASAGTGDVLAGIIAGLLSQGLSYIDAATCGVYLHSTSAGRVQSELGDTGMIAGDLLPALPKVIKSIKER